MQVASANEKTIFDVSPDGAKEARLSVEKLAPSAEPVAAPVEASPEKVVELVAAPVEASPEKEELKTEPTLASSASSEKKKKERRSRTARKSVAGGSGMKKKIEEINKKFKEEQDAPEQVEEVKEGNGPFSIANDIPLRTGTAADTVHDDEEVLPEVLPVLTGGKRHKSIIRMNTGG